MENKMKNPLQSFWKIVWRNNHYFAVACLQMITAGMALMSKAAMSQGMNPYVFVVYRQGFATIALAPFAFFIGRSSSPQLSLAILLKIFLSSLCGLTMSLNMFYLSLNYVSATFASTFINLIPTLTFIIAVCMGVEKVSLRQKHGLIKTVGSLIGLSGTLVLIFVKGPIMIDPVGGKGIFDQSTRVYSNTDWLKGSLFLTLNVFTYSSWSILQGPLLKEYPSSLRLTTLQCFFSCILSAIWTICYMGNKVSWKLKWDLNLISVLYCGVMAAGVAYFLMIFVVGKKGPVFPSLFIPVSLILTAVFSTTIFKEIVYWGSFGGAMLLLVGLYAILWGKNMEQKMNSEAKLEKVVECKATNEHESNEKDGSLELKSIQLNRATEYL